MTKNRRAATFLTAPLLLGLALSPTFACMAGGGQGAQEKTSGASTCGHGPKVTGAGTVDIVHDPSLP